MTMADTMRPSSFLPLIKCSTCNAEINISAMGDHICSQASQGKSTGSIGERLNMASDVTDSGVASPSPESIPWRTNNARSAGRAADASNARFLRPEKSPPARIDPLIANRSFPHRDPYKADGARGIGSLPLRPGPKAAKPDLATSGGPSFVGRQTPSSPESSNLDCAFPPFPIINIKSGTPPDSPRKDITRPSMASHLEAPEPSPLYGPLSPRTYGGENVVQRMNTIAPGPFGVREQRPSEPGQQSNAQLPKVLQVPTVSEKASLSPNNTRALGRGMQPQGPLRPAFDDSGAGQSTGLLGSTSMSAVRPSGMHAKVLTYGTESPPPRVRESMDSSRPGEQSSRQGRASPGRGVGDPPLRSRTLPMANGHADPLQRRPSEPTWEHHAKSPSARSLLRPFERVGAGSEHRQTSGFARSPPAPAFRMHADDREQRRGQPLERRQPTTALTSIDQRSASHQYHTPTPSSSSNGSGYGSDARTSSSRSSPPSTSSPEKLSGKSFNGSLAGKTRNDTHPSKDTPLAQSYAAYSDRPYMARLQQTRTAGLLDKDFVGPPESPLDPALQAGRYLREQTGTARTPLSPRGQRTPIPELSPSPASKGTCRGCGEDIRGKSVSSADGRLSGRYHKHCFVCRTCKEPFNTTTFYVINNHPYCERHYHKLNNSLCQACDRGIEGQYLETERKQKYHPDCLTCQGCRKILRDDYFELNGQVYCEQHAFQLSRQSERLGPGRRNPERRTTRMMVMG